MTWLSDRSGIASIGVAVTAHQPHAPRPMYAATTRNRFLSDSSRSLLIMSHDTRHARARRARTSRPLGQEPEQTHDDCQWLDEKDGKQVRALEQWRAGIGEVVRHASLGANAGMSLGSDDRGAENSSRYRDRECRG